MSDQPKPPKLEEIEARWIEIQSLFDFPFLEVNVFKSDPECPSPSYVVEAGEFSEKAGAEMFSTGVFRATSDIAWLVARVKELEEFLDWMEDGRPL